MTIFGIVTLVKGRISLTRNKVVSGTPAYAIGILLTATLPIVIVFGFCLGLYLGMQAASHGRAPPTAMDFIWVDAAVVLIMAALAVIIAVASGKPPRDESPRDFQTEDVSPFPPASPPSDPENPYSSPFNR